MTVFEMEMRRMKQAIDGGLSNYLTSSSSFAINQNAESARLPKAEYRDVEIRYDVDGDNEDGISDNTLRYMTSFIAGRMKWTTEEDLMEILGFTNLSTDDFHHIMDNSYMIITQVMNSNSFIKMHIKYLLANDSTYVDSQIANRLIYTAVYNRYEHTLDVTVEDNPFTFSETYRQNIESILRAAII